MKRIGQLIFIAVLLVLSVSPVFASDPRNFYDWSSTVDTRQSSSVVLGVSVLAATDSAKPNGTPADPTKYTQFNRYLFGGNIAPDNFFHFLKVAQENVQMVLTFDAKTKDEMRLAIAGERLSEMQELANRGVVNGMESTSRAYDQTMNDVTKSLEKLKSENKPIDDLLKKAEEETAKHSVVLEEVSAKVAPAAKDALERAVEASEQGNDTIADLTGRPAVPPDLVDRITSLKSQGLLTSEEAVKLISFKTRTEARGEMRKYAQEGILPEADLLRMNEAAKNLFPKDFYKIHEIKRFYEMKKLETEKPPEETLKKIQDFAKTYKPGEAVPSDIRRYWGPVVRKEELDNTIRPDFIPRDLFKFNPEDEKKFNEIVERYRPRPEDMAFLNSMLSKNPELASNLPPEYERIQGIGRTYGAQCGAGMKWTGSYCIPENYNEKDLPKSDFAKGRACSGAIASAKGPSGACSAFPIDCLPPGWVRVESCVEGPRDFAAGTRQGTGVKRVECPNNSHFVSVYSGDSGYCVPNYTPTTYGTESACPYRYHRNYQGGPCFSDDSYVPALTSTPGTYPSPFYPPSSQCGAGYNWVPEPINPRGGYCAPQSYQMNFSTTMAPNGSNSGSCAPPPSCLFTEPKCLLPTPPNGWCPAGSYGGSQSRESQEATCKSGGGTCEWNNNMCNCKGYTPAGGTAGCTPPATTNPCPSGQRYSYSSCKCEAATTACSQKWSCPSGMTWNDSTCDCRTASGDWRPINQPGTGCQPPSSGCGGGSYWDYGSCNCRTGGNYPTSCAEPSGGCSQGRYWDRGTCTCATSCGAGSAWNGSSCMPNSNYSNPSPSRESQEATCRAGGGTCVSWVNGACGCQRPGGSTYYPATPSPSGSSGCQMPPGGCGSGSWWDYGTCSCRSSSTPSYSGGSGGSSSCSMPSGGCGSNSWWDYGSCSCRTSSYTPPSSGMGSCSGGQYWNGSNCVSSSTPTPSSTSMSPEEACRQGTNCSWNGSSCQCTATQTSPTPTPTPSPAPTPSPEPTPAPTPTPTP